MADPTLDVIAIGRSSVDLYGAQVGGRLEDMASFSKAVGGCPTNIAIGTARLGLKSGLITRVGDEHMGRFIREQCAREGVDVAGVRTDPKRLTSLVVLGIRDDKTFPLIFYRDNCADSALDESDIEEAYVARAKAIVVTGTHFARANTAAAQNLAVAYAGKHRRKVAFDIDYRPNLWGLAGHGAGEERYVKSDAVTAHLQKILPACDLVVGTEEEIMIAGGAEEALAALRAVRALTRATIVLKRGPMGCVVFPGAIPNSIEDGVKGPGFPVEVYNVLGAGDAFMSGFLRGWLRDEPLETCCAFANAGGAFAVSRLLCSAEYPTWPELQRFLNAGSPHRALATRRGAEPYSLGDDAAPAAAGPDGAGDRSSRAARENRRRSGSAARAHQPVQAPRRRRRRRGRGRAPGFGMLLDGKYGREALFRAADHDFWIGRPVEEPGSRPLDFEFGGSLGAKLIEWPVAHTIKCLCFYHPDDAPEMKARQERELLRLTDAARTIGRELLIEIIASKNGEIADDTVSRVLDRLYAIGVKPDWWKLEGQASAKAWDNVAAVVEAHDPWCRGIMLLGLDAPEEDLAAAFRIARGCALVRGFAVGRTIFVDPALNWFAGRIDDAEAVRGMAESFARLCALWQDAAPGGAP